MLKKYSLLLLAAFVLTFSASAQSRLVLYEEHTGEGCGPCAATNPGLDTLMLKPSNTYKVCMIKFMSLIAGGYHFYDMARAVDSQRAEYYPTPFVPAGWMNGGTLGSPPYVMVTQSAIDVEAAVPSPFILSVSSMFNLAHDTITILVKAKAVASYIRPGSTIKLRVARCKSIHINPDTMWNGEDHVHNVVRDMFPDASGTTISNTWYPGDYQQWVFKGTVNKENFTGWYPSLHFSDSSVVAWIQDENDKRVAQCAKENVWMGTPKADVESIENDVVHLNLHPNPANSTLYVNANVAEAQDVNISITDISGRTFYNQSRSLSKGDNNVAVDVRDLPAGMYALTLMSGGNVRHRAFTILK